MDIEKFVLNRIREYQIKELDLTKEGYEKDLLRRYSKLVGFVKSLKELLTSKS